MTRQHDSRYRCASFAGLRAFILLRRAIAMLALASVLLKPAFAENGEYRIQPGDVLYVHVWGEDALQGEFLTRPDGFISFPLAGQIAAAGRQFSEVEAELSAKLAKFIPDPQVTVAAKQLLGNKVYVIGKVNRPGEFPINRPTDVVQALAMAGGMTPYAATGKIKVLRREGGQLKAIPFDYGDIEKGRNLEQNIVLKAGDVVVVP